MIDAFVLKFNDLTEDAQKRFVEYTGELLPGVMKTADRPVAVYFGKVTNLDIPTVAVYLDISAQRLIRT